MWAPLAIRHLEDGDDGLMYPIPTTDKNGIMIEPADGGRVAVVRAKSVTLTALGGESSEELASAKDVDIALYIADSRVAFACTKFDKGGGWYGGVTAMVVFNAVSKARAAVRRRGRSLVGHIRYPWLSDVGYTSKTGWLSDETIRLVTKTRDGSEEVALALDLVLPKSASARDTAADIVRRSATYRLERTSIDSDDERERLNALVNPPSLTPQKGKFALWNFPTHFFPSPATSYGNLDEPASPPVQPADVPSTREVASVDNRPTDPVAGGQVPRARIFLGDGTVHELSRPLVIGRDPSAPGREPAARPLTVNDPTVSKTHAFVGVDERGVYVVDLASSNGTWLAGRDSPIESDQPERVASGDAVRLGRDTEFLVNYRHT